MIILDTNVLSELMRNEPNQQVVDWLDAQDPGSMAVTSITVAEIFYGIARLPDGKRKGVLFSLATEMFDEEFAGSILPFDEEAALDYAVIVAASERMGRAVSMADAQIAAIAGFHDATVATRNVKDFTPLGVATINPWD